MVSYQKLLSLHKASKKTSLISSIVQSLFLPRKVCVPFLQVLAVITRPSYLPSLVYEPCREEELVGLTAANHPLSKKGKAYVKELAQVPFVNLQGSRSERIVRKLEKQGIKLEVAMNCDTAEALQTAVQKGIGMAVVFCDRMKAEMTAEGVKIIKIVDFPVHVDTFTIFHRKRPLSPKARDSLVLLQRQRQKA